MRLNPKRIEWKPTLGIIHHDGKYELIPVKESFKVKEKKKKPQAEKAVKKQVKSPANQVIRVSVPVLECIKGRAEFGDSYDSVLRRELGIPANA